MKMRVLSMRVHKKTIVVEIRKILLMHAKNQAMVDGEATKTILINDVTSLKVTMKMCA